MKRIVIGVVAGGALIALLLAFAYPTAIKEEGAPLFLETNLPDFSVEGAGEGVDPEYRVAEEAYIEAKQELESVLNERQDELDPEIAQPLEENIGFIEGAVVDLLAALTQDPDNESLKQMLLEMYRREVKMLKGVLDITN